VIEFSQSEMTIIEIKTLTYLQGLSLMGGLLSITLMVYGFFTSLLLPYMFFNRLSH